MIGISEINFFYFLIYQIFLLAGPSQVKWNKRNEYLFASAHDGDVRIWDVRVRMRKLLFSFISLYSFNALKLL